MGKSKDEHNERKRSSPRGADEERTKKRKSKEEEEKNNHESKKKHKSHKSSKHRSDKDNKSGEKRKDKDKSRRKRIINFQELSNEDYFSKNNEFAMWLKEEKDIFFSELSSESARSLFSKFVKDWNNQKLEPQYYEGIAAGPRTTYNWNIKK